MSRLLPPYRSARMRLEAHCECSNMGSSHDRRVRSLWIPRAATGARAGAHDRDEINGYGCRNARNRRDAIMNWEKIETAPKNSYILLCLAGREWAIGCWNKYINFDGGWVNDDGTESTPFMLKPTHWMPLPELPEETWSYHEPTSESGDSEFWASSYGRISLTNPIATPPQKCSVNVLCDNSLTKHTPQPL